MQELQAGSQSRYIERRTYTGRIERHPPRRPTRKVTSRHRTMGMTMQLVPTRTDPLGSREWTIDDDVVRLREWGSERTYELPRTPESRAEWSVGSASTCEIRLDDARRMVSRHHARLVRAHGGWVMHDVGSKNGLWIDNGRRLAIGLSPGVEVGIGSLTLIAESEGLVTLRAMLSGLLGWADIRRGVVDRALRSIRTSATLSAPLVLYGDGNLVDIARQIHRAAFGTTRPFIVCDPRRRSFKATSRSAESRTTLADAMRCVAARSACGRAACRSILKTDETTCESVMYEHDSSFAIAIRKSRQRRGPVSFAFLHSPSGSTRSMRSRMRTRRIPSRRSVGMQRGPECRHTSASGCVVGASVRSPSSRAQSSASSPLASLERSSEHPNGSVSRGALSRVGSTVGTERPRHEQVP